MSKSKLFVAGALVAAVLVSNVGTAVAWHPEGEIKKYVQNVTANSEVADANTAAEAVEAKVGDTLKYVIVIKNTAQPADKQYNDLAFIELTDTLPVGVELVSDPTVREIKEDLATLKPGESVTKEYQVKVVSQVNDGQVIENTACFSGDSVVKDNPKEGCDAANVKVTVPEVPEEPETPEQPKPDVKGKGTDVPNELPHTGLNGVLGLAAGVTAISTAAAAFVNSRRK